MNVFRHTQPVSDHNCTLRVLKSLEKRSQAFKELENHYLSSLPEYVNSRVVIVNREARRPLSNRNDDTVFPLIDDKRPTKVNQARDIDLRRVATMHAVIKRAQQECSQSGKTYLDTQMRALLLGANSCCEQAHDVGDCVRNKSSSSLHKRPASSDVWTSGLKRQKLLPESDVHKSYTGDDSFSEMSVDEDGDE